MLQMRLSLFGGAPRRFPQIGLAHRDAFPIHGDGENRAGLFHLPRVLRALLFVKQFEVTARAQRRLLDLSFGNRHPCLIADGDHHLVGGFFGRRTSDLTLQSMRIALWRKIQLGVKRVQTFKPTPAVALAIEGDFSKDRLKRSGMKTLMRMLLSIGVDDRFGDRAGAAFIEVTLENPPQYFATIDVEKLLQFTMSHAIN